MKLKRGLIVLFALASAGSLGAWAFSGLAEEEAKSCVQIYFDSESQDQLASGRKFAQEVQELLSPYVGIQINKLSISKYKSGDLKRCTKGIYIGTHFDHRVPRVFVEDFMNARGNVAWFGYNIWQMGLRLEVDLGLRFIRMPRQEKEGTFDEILYQGGHFKKAQFGHPREQVELLPSDLSKFSTLAESRNSVTREIIPYAIQSKNRFYIADVPNLQTASAHMSLMLREILARFMESSQSPGAEKPIALLD